MLTPKRLFMKKYVTTLFSFSLLTAFTVGEVEISEVREVKEFVATTETSSWIVVYNKKNHFVKITDFSNQEKTIIIPENEGLVFIKDIVKDDPDKIRKFKIE
jgi:hypothetical protein